MNDEDNLQPSAGGASSEGGSVPEAMRGRLGYLYKQYQFLEMLVALTISALILMSLGLNLFLFKQMRLVRGQLSAQKNVSSALLDEFHNKREPDIQNFVTALQGYAETTPEFRPLLEKYRPHLSRYFTRPGSYTPPGTDTETK